MEQRELTYGRVPLDACETRPRREIVARAYVLERSRGSYSGIPVVHGTVSMAAPCALISVADVASNGTK